MGHPRSTTAKPQHTVRSGVAAMDTNIAAADTPSIVMHAQDARNLPDWMNARFAG